MGVQLACLRLPRSAHRAARARHAASQHFPDAARYRDVGDAAQAGIDAAAGLDAGTLAQPPAIECPRLDIFLNTVFPVFWRSWRHRRHALKTQPHVHQSPVPHHAALVRVIRWPCPCHVQRRSPLWLDRLHDARRQFRPLRLPVCVVIAGWQLERPSRGPFRADVRRQSMKWYEQERCKR